MPLLFKYVLCKFKIVFSKHVGIYFVSGSCTCQLQAIAVAGRRENNGRFSLNFDLLCNMSKLNVKIWSNKMQSQEPLKDCWRPGEPRPLALNNLNPHKL